MQIVIDIPEEEFGIDIEDKFQDFFKRLKAEIKERIMSGTTLVCGAYELETIEMFLNAFANATPLPKGHGRLIDADEAVQRICGLSCGCTVEECGYEVPCFSVRRINSAPTIIDKEQE